MEMETMVEEDEQQSEENGERNTSAGGSAVTQVACSPLLYCAGQDETSLRKGKVLLVGWWMWRGLL